MLRYIVALSATLLFLVSPAFPDVEKASEIVSCINATNEELESDKRDFAFADIETLQEDYRLQFVEGFFLVHGLPLHGFAWGLILDVTVRTTRSDVS